MQPVSARRLAAPMRRGRAARRAHLSCLALALAFALGGCSRRSSEPAPPSETAKPSAAPSATASAPRSVSSKPSPPPVTPAVAPQLVACGDRDFYRITWSALQAFEIAAQLPPPQIRGSLIARQISELPVAEPLNVFLAAKKKALVIAKGSVFRYAFGESGAQRYAPIPVSAPLAAWPAPGSADSFRVQNAGDLKLRDYSLAGLPTVAADAPPPPALVARHTEDLPGFDARLFTQLSDQRLFYSTPKGLVRRGDESRPIPFPELSGAPTIVFADANPERFWAAGATGQLALLNLDQGASPAFAATVPGVVIDAAHEGERVAVLSVKLSGHGYSAIVTIFSDGKDLARLDIGPSFARQQPALDLCLISGRPWVVVAGRNWLQLLDWESRRLLAEW